MRNFEFKSTSDAWGKVSGIWFFNRTPVYRISSHRNIRGAILAFKTSRSTVDEGYFVCADLSLIAISYSTAAFVSPDVMRAAWPEASNPYEMALSLEDSIAAYPDLMAHLQKFSEAMLPQ